MRTWRELRFSRAEVSCVGLGIALLTWSAVHEAASIAALQSL